MLAWSGCRRVLVCLVSQNKCNEFHLSLNRESVKGRSDDKVLYLGSISAEELEEELRLH